MKTTLKFAVLSAVMVSLAPAAFANNMKERSHLYTYFDQAPKAAPQKPMQMTAEERVRQTLNQWIVAVNTRAPAQLTKLYDTNAILQPAISSVMHGTPEMRARYLTHLTKASNLHVTLNSSHVRVIGDMAMVDGTYTFTYKKKNKAVTIPERFSIVYERKADGWMIVNHHASKLPKKTTYSSIKTAYNN